MNIEWFQMCYDNKHISTLPFCCLLNRVPYEFQVDLIDNILIINVYQSKPTWLWILRKWFKNICIWYYKSKLNMYDCKIDCNVMKVSFPSLWEFQSNFSITFKTTKRGVNIFRVFYFMCYLTTTTIWHYSTKRVWNNRYSVLDKYRFPITTNTKCLCLVIE